MKNQLIHQTSCYDCGPTSITNAMRFLFEREPANKKSSM